MNKNKNEIGLNIKRIRLDKKWSQDELAEKVYSTKSTISKWENGDIIPSIDVLKIIAKALNVSLYNLLGEKTPIMSKILNILGKVLLWGFVWCYVDVLFVGLMGGLAIGFAFIGCFAGLGWGIAQTIGMIMTDSITPLKVAMCVGCIVLIPLLFAVFEIVAFILYVPARQVHMFSRKHFWRAKKYNYKLNEFSWFKKINKKTWIIFATTIAIGLIYMSIILIAGGAANNLPDMFTIKF